VPFDAPLLAPAQDREARQLGAVVGNAHEGAATARHDGLGLAHDPRAGKRGVGDQCQAFAAEVVDDCQDAEPSTVGERAPADL
jgi:hypothetical protein